MEVAVGAPSMGRDLVPEEAGRPHVDRGHAIAFVPGLEEAALGPEDEAGLAGAVHLGAGDAARGVAAGRGLGAVGVPEPQREVGAGRVLDERELVEAHAAVPVPQGTRERRGDRDPGPPPVDHHEVVAEPMHLLEGQADVGFVTHGAHIVPNAAWCQRPLTPAPRDHMWRPEWAVSSVGRATDS
jgi:hypothetical protein